MPKTLLPRLLAVLSLLLVGCVSGGSDQEAATERGAYQLSAGDTVEVAIFGEDRLSGTYDVRQDGSLVLPLIGAVEAEGRPVEALADQLRAALADGLLVNPDVVVTLVDPLPIYVLGEVRTPGEFDYRPGLTATMVVARAGGFTYRADKRRVFVTRAGDDDERAFDLGPRTILQPGDTVRIGQRLF